VQLYGVGVPTITWNSPAAVDHLPFYGPVFFNLTAISLHFVGPRLLAFRLVSAAGAALFLVAAVLLARVWSDDEDRWRWSLVLLAISPQVNAGMGAGAMHILAVGLEVAAMAMFAAGLTRESRSVWHGACAGVLLTLAALTTPRSYPFIVGFFSAACVPGIFGGNARAGLRQVAWVGLVVAAGWLLWTTVSHEGPIRWLRYMSYIALHEDTDVAVLPTAVRQLSFGWSAALTTLFAVGGAIVVAIAIARDTSDSSRARARGMAFGLAATWVGLVITAVVMNYTFSIADYFVLPLLAVLLATPRLLLDMRPRLVAVGTAVLVVCCLGVLAFRCVRVAATWDARDPEPLNGFVSMHVPKGSVVVGPEAPYFFPVERSGSRYRTMSPRSWADWARWVPLVEPEARLVARRGVVTPAHQRFLILPTDDGIPAEYECAKNHLVAVFHPAPNWMSSLGPFGLVNAMDNLGYVESSLFRLPHDCPVGYDPTIRIASK
jgi:hypothetical protein